MKKRNKEENENRLRAGGTACKRNIIEEMKGEWVLFVLEKEGSKWREGRSSS